MEKNSSVCTKVERCVASWGSSRPNPSGKDKIEAGMPISTAYGEHIMEMQNPLAGFPHDESELLLDTFYDNLDSIMDGSGGGGGNY
ncbi:hypothetical protein FCM35_KLT18876 [Carex littledalei]|uniref:Uncharacterized protein n=1 Tax=Carex littledalei TaxID=544730 RepID=A0A833QVZ3_9POAL|nr:hypothetical protein FCM35_KLT18876 [Carex littledalei]